VNLPEGFIIKNGAKSIVFRAREWQVELLKRRGISYILKSRQVGCTTLASLFVLQRALNGVCGLIVTRSEGQVQQIIKIMRTAVSPLSLDYDALNHVLHVPFGEDIYFSNSNFESVRGLSAGTVYVTECGEIRDFARLQESVIPVVTAYSSDFRIWFDGTVPRELNGFVLPFTRKYTGLIEKARGAGFAARDEYFCVYGKSAVSTAAEAREFEMVVPAYSGVLTCEEGVSLNGLGIVYSVGEYTFLVEGDTFELLDGRDGFVGYRITPCTKILYDRHIKVVGFNLTSGIARAQTGTLEAAIFGILGGR
jgi:hypothetical protein